MSSMSTDTKNANTARNEESQSPQEATLTRRAFLNKVSVAITAFGALLVGIPVIGYLFAPLFEQVPREWRAVGRIESFKIGQTVEVTFLDASPLPWSGVAAKTAAWLRRESDREFIAYSVNCTHLGCPVSWLQGADLFLCPCHGGVYYKDGTVAAGPPPHPLTRYPTRINNGIVEVLTSPIPITS